MNRKNFAVLAQVFGLIGVLFILAMAFNVLASNTALFLAVASFVVAGVVWAIRGQLDEK